MKAEKQVHIQPGAVDEGVGIAENPAVTALLEALCGRTMLAAVYNAENVLVFATQTFVQAFAIENLPAPVTFADIILHNATNRCGAVIEHHDPLSFLADTQARRRETPGSRTFATDLQWPLVSDAETLHETGWVTLIGIENTLQKVHERRLETARHAALVEARTDPLTGLSNRRHIVELLETAVKTRISAPLSGGLIAMIDLDRFKEINDRYGHDGGDATLKDFANVCQSILRPVDVVGRVGGEEFLVIFPGLGIVSAARMMAALSDRLCEEPRVDRGAPTRYSFSRGLHQLERSDTPAVALKRPVS